MADSLQVAIKKLLKVADRARTQAARGKAFEDLACLIFESIQGVSVTHRNALDYFDSEEIDVALYNDQHPRGLKTFAPFLLVECKNWSKPVGSAEVNTFVTKLRHRGLDFGILIAANGITGSPEDGKNAHQAVTCALIEKIRLIVITRAEIEALRAGDALVSLIKAKVGQLIVTGTIWP